MDTDIRYVSIDNKESLDECGCKLALLQREAWRTVLQKLDCYTSEYETNEAEWGLPLLTDLLGEGAVWYAGVDAHGDPVSSLAVKEVGHMGTTAWEIRRLVVDPSMRGKGLSQGLLNNIENLAKGKGVPYLTLFTSSRLPGLLTHYQALGFVEYQRVPVERWGKKYDRVFFQKALSDQR